jgi:hypothetical protein
MLGSAVLVLNPGKDRYFSFFFFAAMHFLTHACMPGTLPAHLASQAASDPCFAWGPAIAGVSDASTTIPQTIKARMSFLSNLKPYLNRLRPSNQCPAASRLDELSLAQIDSHRCGAEIGRRQPVDRLPLGRELSAVAWHRRESFRDIITPTSWQCSIWLGIPCERAGWRGAAPVGRSRNATCREGSQPGGGPGFVIQMRRESAALASISRVGHPAAGQAT